MHPPDPTPSDAAAPALDRLGLPGDDEVLRALLHRRATGSRPGARTDGHRIALVVGGGGMRGAYAGGMAHALDDAGLGPAFDVVYGSSAGAFVGAAVLLGDGHGSARIFSEDMACRDFIDPRRAVRGRRRPRPGRRAGSQPGSRPASRSPGSRPVGSQPVVSLDHLIDHILVTAKPLPWERLRDSPAPLRVVATAVDDMSGHVLEPETVDEWRLALRATAAIPLLAGPPVLLHDRYWIDGSVAEPLPVLRALADGATHVLALLTRTVPELRRADPGHGPARWARALDRFAPGLGAMAQDVRRHAPVLALLDDAAHPARAAAHLLALAPAVDAGVRGLTTDVPRVERAAAIGHATVSAALRRTATPPAA